MKETTATTPKTSPLTLKRSPMNQKKKNKKRKTTTRSSESFSGSNKRTLVKRLVREHRMSTLTVGALTTNVKRTTLPVHLQEVVKTIIWNCVDDANSVKREAQLALALFIKSSAAPELESLKTILHKAKDDDKDTDEDAYTNQGEEGSDPNSASFLLTLLRCLYYREDAPSTRSPHQVLIRKILSSFYEVFTESPNRKTREPGKKRKGETANCLFTSVSITMSVEYQRFFHVCAGGKPSKLPLSPIADGFISMSERELFYILCENSEAMDAYLGGLIQEHFPETEKMSIVPTLDTLPPGWLINQVISPVGSTSSCRKGLAKITTVTTKDEMAAILDGMGNSSSSATLQDVRRESAVSTDETMKEDVQSTDNQPRFKYALYGSFQTNGVELHLRAIDLSIRRSKCFALAEERHMPCSDQLYDPEEGHDQFLKEIRNVLDSKERVEQIFGQGPGPLGEDVDILCLDPGQACTVAAYAVRADHPGVGLSLVAKSKAIYQPTFKFRQELQQRKDNEENEAGVSIADIESSIPSLDQDPKGRIKAEMEHGKDLWKFYNGHNAKFLRARWDADKAREGEYGIITDRLLSMLGGVHVRSLDYLVVGINEYYTSKRCPKCQRSGRDPLDFVSSASIRRLFCESCKTPFHRD
ncbi:hypothetical protein BGW38_007160, partial [Lunasporangiospora selenospora]